MIFICGACYKVLMTKMWGRGFFILIGILLLLMAAATIYFQGVKGSLQRESASLADDLNDWSARETQILNTKQQRVEFFRKRAFLDQGRQSVSSQVRFLSALSRITPGRIRLSGLQTRWTGQNLSFALEGEVQGRSRQDILRVFNRFVQGMGRMDAVIEIGSKHRAWSGDTRLEFMLEGIWEE